MAAFFKACHPLLGCEGHQKLISCRGEQESRPSKSLKPPKAKRQLSPVLVRSAESECPKLGRGDDGRTTRCQRDEVGSAAAAAVSRATQLRESINY